MISTYLVPIAVILILVFINGIFVAAEFALVGSRKSRFEEYAQKGNRSAKWIISVFDRPTGKDGYIAIAQLGITLASIGLGMYGEPTVAKWLYGPFEDWGLSYSAAHTFGFIVALSGITYMHVVFGEMIPKALALQTPEKVCLRINPIMRTFGVLFRPMVAVLNFVAIKLMHLIRIPEPDKAMSLYTSQELAIVTDEAAQGGQIGEMQREIIRNIFELEDITAQELMTSRSNLEVVDLNISSEEISELIVNSSRSRYPVIDGGLDNVVGILHVKDFIRVQQKGIKLTASKLMRKIPAVSENATAEQLLDLFKKDRTHASLVVDEYGSTLGLVTLDDIIADVMEEDDSINGPVHNADGSISVDGELTLAETKDDLGIELIYEDVTTLSGIIMSELGTMPNVGDSVELQGHELVVEHMSGHKITRIRIRAIDSNGY